MGVIIKNLSGRRPSIFIERRVDDIETQKLTFNLTNEAWLSTDTGDSIRLLDVMKITTQSKLRFPFQSMN